MSSLVGEWELSTTSMPANGASRERVPGMRSSKMIA